MKSIVVGTDFSKGSLVALEIAILIANRMNSGLVLIWVHQNKSFLGLDNDEQMITLAKQRLDEIKDQYKGQLEHGEFRCEIVNGKVAPTLASKAKEYQAPMIVIGTNGASGFEKYWMGSTAVRIVQEAPCPTLTVREGYAFHTGLKRIVVPIRPASDNSRQKVPPATVMAKIFDAEIHVLGLRYYDNDAAELKIHMDQVDKFLTEEGVKHVSVMKKCDDYCDTVMEYAEEINADLIVINTEQDKIISQLFLGTNAQKIVHKSQVPVLCLHPTDIFSVAR